MIFFMPWVGGYIYKYDNIRLHHFIAVEEEKRGNFIKIDKKGLTKLLGVWYIMGKKWWRRDLRGWWRENGRDRVCEWGGSASGWGRAVVRNGCRCGGERRWGDFRCAF